jgi:hypothetical protein
MLPLALDLPDHQTWVIPLVGVASAGVALVMGRALFGRRRADLVSPPARKEPAAEPADPFIHGSAMERRRALRRRGGATPVLVSDAEVTVEPYQGWVLNRSTGGLCLAVANEVPLEVVLSILPLNAPETTPWVQVTVKECRRGESDWELSCQFVKTPPYSVLLMFG